MANTTLSTLFTNIANAIRSKTGKNETIKAVDFPAEISNISVENDLIISPNTGGVFHVNVSDNTAIDVNIMFYGSHGMPDDMPVSSLNIKYIVFRLAKDVGTDAPIERCYKISVLENDATEVTPIDGYPSDTINSVNITQGEKMIEATINLTPSSGYLYSGEYLMSGLLIGTLN